MSIPNALDRGRTDSLGFGHAPTTPVGRPLRFRLQSGFNDAFHLGGGNRSFTASAGFHLGQGRGTPLRESLPPQQHGGTPDAQLLGDLIVRHPLGSFENNTAAGHDLLRSLVRANPRLKHRFLFRTDGQRLGWLPHAQQYIPNRTYCILICETIH